MLLFMKFGDRTVDFMCYDTEDSKRHSEGILTGRTYPHIPFVNEVEIIVDVGANIGASSVFFSLYYPEATIYSIEPQQGPFEIMSRNTQGNPKNRRFNFGLFNCDKTVPLYHSWVDSGTASVGQSWLNTTESETIQLRDAGTWLLEEGIARIDILKIDTEGCETHILSRMAHLIPLVKVIYLEYHSDEDRRAIDSMVAPSHVLYRAKAEHAHCGEVVYVRSNLEPQAPDLHKHRIKI
jgi:FkbM family methyltransferase